MGSGKDFGSGVVDGCEEDRWCLRAVGFMGVLWLSRLLEMMVNLNFTTRCTTTYRIALVSRLFSFTSYNINSGSTIL